MNLSLSEYKAIVEFSPNMIWRAGTDARCNYFNETWLKFTGKIIEDEVGDGWLNGVHPDDVDFCMQTYLASFQKQEVFEMEYRLVRYDKKWRWINDRGVPFFDEQGLFAGYIGSCMDVTEKVEGIKLTEMAHKDKLTGIYNRNYLDFLMEYEFQKGLKSRKDLIFMLIDIDKFKLFNDLYGHGFGDRVLKSVAQKFSENIREKDVVGRYGGDEFVIILPQKTIDEVTHIAKRIISSMEKIEIEDKVIHIGISIGIVKQQGELILSEVIKKADRAMYLAKQAGGNQYRISE